VIDPNVLSAMRRDWDARAKANARHYVATSKTEWSEDDFFASGAAEIHEIVEKDLAAISMGRSPSDMRALEIGCGAGRMTAALSRVFGHVDGVDVSPEMVDQARTALRNFANVNLYVNNGIDLSMFPSDRFHFAISAVVFQHIPRRAVVENYIKETHRVLCPGSLFKFQLQGYPIGEKEADTWVGVGFSEQQMRVIAAKHGFQIKNSTGAGTQYYWLTFAKP
jgi:ubiquinone/menaquinone biosynthesis C-methylase UbiE